MRLISEFLCIDQDMESEEGEDREERHPFHNAVAIMLNFLESNLTLAADKRRT